jgi:hypothetical protein
MLLPEEGGRPPEHVGENTVSLYVLCMCKLLFFFSGTSSPLCLRIFKEESRVRQKHNCLGIVFIAAMVTTCFGRAWPSSGHNGDVLHK